MFLIAHETCNKRDKTGQNGTNVPLVPGLPDGTNTGKRREALPVLSRQPVPPQSPEILSRLRL